MGATYAGQMRRYATVLLLLGLMAGACGEPAQTNAGPSPSPGPTARSSSDATERSPTPSEQATPGPRTGTRIITAGSDFGPMLYDRTGQPIYLFDKERTAEPACYGQCAADWPPVLTRGEPKGVQGARQSLLGTTERRDGTVQVTYAGHPLYFYAHEGKYQVLCHDIEEYGGVWLVVRPDGRPAA